MADDILGVSEGDPGIPVLENDTTSQSSSPEDNETQKQDNGAQNLDANSQPKSKEFNFKALREENKRLQEQVSRASHFEKTVLSNQQLAPLVTAALQGQDLTQLAATVFKLKQEVAAAEQKDPFGEFHPIVADKFRKLEQLEKLIEKQQSDEKQFRENQEVERVVQNVKTLDKSFDDLIAKSAFKSAPAQDQEAIADATLQHLQRNGINPLFATNQQMETSLNTVLKSLTNLSKFSLGKESRTVIPASGSAQGVQAGSQKPKGQDGRIQSLLDSLG